MKFLDFYFVMSFVDCCNRIIVIHTQFKLDIISLVREYVNFKECFITFI